MGLSQTLALWGFVVGNVLAACPYADQLASRSDVRDMPDSHEPAIGKRAEGKKGVFYMSVLPDSQDFPVPTAVANQDLIWSYGPVRRPATSSKSWCCIIRS